MKTQKTTNQLITAKTQNNLSFNWLHKIFHSDISVNYMNIYFKYFQAM